MTAVVFLPQHHSLLLTLLSPTLPVTTGPICHQCQAGTKRSDVAACSTKKTTNVATYSEYMYTLEIYD